MDLLTKQKQTPQEQKTNSWFPQGMAAGNKLGLFYILTQHCKLTIFQQNTKVYMLYFEYSLE